MKPSSTHDIVNALNIISVELETTDGVPNALIAEASQRLLELVQLTADLTSHVISNPVHHARCNAKTKGTYCNCILARLIPT
jgi:hypothetical protein